MNDTTPSAVLVGKILVWDAGTCTMHVVDLVIKHAMGLVIRTKTYDAKDQHGLQIYDDEGNKLRTKETIDSFPECLAVKKRVWDAISHLQILQSRFDGYQVMMKEKSRESTRMLLPNSTR